ncbi:protein translocase subunit secG [Panacagrimonas perspica]|uniref:Protein-export membrane protein SecG n=1 Tax=Panacagrimonas perspica TaxID=381431 RepID=A0A4S3JZA5_9GAMM|nr:preprotein translocase subunit SecG [Panacagrimonas perspica]TDU32813.1 protein translocase subunit secG [Panacagrimonas perspica]THD00929.1 preprotein translocase subunit SecG [Panacagrimonas perspica]
MHTVLVVVQVLVAVALIGLVLIQHGKGADAGAAFGSGASGTVFGARGAANFLTRTTAWLAAAFFASSLGLAYLVNDRTGRTSGSVTDQIETPAPGPVTEEPRLIIPAPAEAPAAVAPQAPAPAEEAPKVPE